MSLQVELEPDDRKFIKETKSAWAYAKKQMVWLLVTNGKDLVRKWICY